MDPRIAKVAKDIPAMLRRVSNDMFDEATPALRTGVNAVRDALRKVERYLGEVESVHLGSAPATKAAPPAKGARGKRRRGKRRFMIGDFLVEKLTENPKGMRPKDLATLVAEAAPGRHKDPASITHTTLARLRAMKKVTNRDGVWMAVKSA